MELEWLFRIVPSPAKELVFFFFSMIVLIHHCIQAEFERDGLTRQLKACLTAKATRPSVKHGLGGASQCPLGSC